MDKLKLAHDYALEMAKQGIALKSCKELGWKYADAMQAEAEKRSKAEAAQKRKEMREMLNADNTFVERDGEHFDDVEEWQPDWSQAPDTLVKYFAVDEDGRGGWFVSKPTLCSDHWFWSDFEERFDNDHYDHAPSFNYQGNWQDSLRERPEALCEVDWRVAPCWAKEWVMRYGAAKWECGTSSNSWENAPSFGFTGSHIVERPHGF